MTMKKTLFTFLCICITLLIVSCGKTPQSPQDNNEETNGGYEEAYSDVISQYTNLLTAKHNGEELPKPNNDGMDEREAKIAEAIHGIVSAHKTTKDMGYGYKDLDGNGIPELMLMNKAAYFYAIFTLSDNKPILLISNNDNNVLLTVSKNRFLMSCITETDNIQETIIYTCYVDGEKMSYDTVYGAVYDKGQEKREILERFQIIDNERVSVDEETFEALYLEYRQATSPDEYKRKFWTPRIHLPLKSNVTNEGLQVLDFSDYDAIRESFKVISACLDDFNIRNWSEGEYDNLFAFSNDTDFDYYIRLLFTTHYYTPQLGYDEIDLNGDGEDELVIMNEKYDIMAVFTQKNGTPVMLDIFGSDICWLDEQGLLHVDNQNHQNLEHRLYEFTKDSKFNLLYSFIISSGTRYNGYYFIKDNKSEIISRERYSEIFDDYRRYSVPFGTNEQTRNVSALTYTPLNETTNDLVKNATGKTWYKNANISEENYSHSSTYVTFENATDTQMDVNFKYVFTFLYPDPNDEHKYLDSTTESYLKITVRKENGEFVFDENGVKGKFEFENSCLWIIFEESTDQRFPKGAYCFSEYSDKK